MLDAGAEAAHETPEKQEVCVRHLCAELIDGREQYLQHLSEKGYSQARLQRTESYLQHFIRVMNLTGLRDVSMDELRTAGRNWALDNSPNRKCYFERGKPETFVRIAKQWLTFHGRLPVRPQASFSKYIELYAEFLTVRRLAPTTISTYRRKVESFLRWFSKRHHALEALQLSHVQEYLEIGRAAGRKPTSLACQCQSLRSFLAYSATQGWCDPSICACIQNPPIRKYQGSPRGPQWKEVQRLIRDRGETAPINLRTRATLLLLAIYGLRVSEVARLLLTDFDWRFERFTVRRSKQGGVQYFPIQKEVGEAIIHYLEKGRPNTTCRHLFVNLVSPFGPQRVAQIYRCTRMKMEEVGIKVPNIGPHCLRHACATQLLKKGSSLQEIADFLGHRSPHAVGIYARHDERSLRKVANSTLAGVL